jgi:hypothetical protein
MIIFQSNLLINPIGNGWNWLKTKAIIPPDILNAHNNTREWHYVFAVLEFTIHGQNRQNNNFRGTTMQYFEVTRMSSFKWSVNKNLFVFKKYLKVNFEVCIN